MKIMAIVIFLCFLSPEQLVPMFWPSTPGPFSAHVANNCCEEYNKLAAYLYEHSDKKRLPTKEFDKAEATTIHQWVSKNALQDGNVVSLYFYVRNYLEKSAKECFPEIEGYFMADQVVFYGPEIIAVANDLILKAKINKLVRLRMCLIAILLCLQRVAYDAIHYRSCIDSTNTSVLNAYAIFKQKFHFLLKYIPNVAELLDSERLSFLNFKNICKASIDHIQERGWGFEAHSCTWISGFAWSHPWTPGSMGIFFGPPADVSGSCHCTPTNPRWMLKQTLNLFGDIDVDVVPPESPITFNDTQISSWKEFFQSYEFPTT